MHVIDLIRSFELEVKQNKLHRHCLGKSRPADKSDTHARAHIAGTRLPPARKSNTSSVF